MPPKKRLKPMSGWKEIFQIPTIIYFPALLVSSIIFVLSFFIEPFSMIYFFGGILAALLFTILIYFAIVIPAIRASILKQDAINTIATVLKKEKRSRWIGTIEPGNRSQVSFTTITFEFVPEGSTSPLQIEAEVQKVTPSMQEGKTMKISYSKSNPRIIRLPGE
jgi:hypothetical protein